jgi:hypothetical protein
MPRSPGPFDTATAILRCDADAINAALAQGLKSFSLRAWRSSELYPASWQWCLANRRPIRHLWREQSRPLWQWKAPQTQWLRRVNPRSSW